MSIRPGVGAAGSDRVTLLWPAGTIVGLWLEVRLHSSANTGLRSDDVFYFGSAPGESTGGSDGTTQVNATDFAAVRAGATNFLQPAAVNNPLDHNRDGRVNALDLLIVRDHATLLGGSLMLISPASINGAAPQLLAEVFVDRSLFRPAGESTDAGGRNKFRPTPSPPMSCDPADLAARDRWFASYPLPSPQHTVSTKVGGDRLAAESDYDALLDELLPFAVQD